MTSLFPARAVDRHCGSLEVEPVPGKQAHAKLPQWRRHVQDSVFRCLNLYGKQDAAHYLRTGGMFLERVPVEISIAERNGGSYIASACIVHFRQ